MTAFSTTPSNFRFPYLIGSALAYSGLFDLLRQTPVELLYFAVTAAMLYACVRLQSRALLLTTVLAMLGFIGYFTARHFVDSLGWPISLVLMGVAFIGVAYWADAKGLKHKWPPKK